VDGGSPVVCRRSRWFSTERTVPARAIHRTRPASGTAPGRGCSPTGRWQSRGRLPDGFARGNKQCIQRRAGHGCQADHKTGRAMAELQQLLLGCTVPVRLRPPVGASAIAFMEEQGGQQRAGRAPHPLASRMPQVAGNQGAQRAFPGCGGCGAKRHHLNRCVAQPVAVADQQRVQLPDVAARQ